MNLINAIKTSFDKLFERRIPEVPRSPENQATGRQRDTSPATDRMDLESIKHDRHSRYQEIQKMTKNDPRWNRMLRKLASDAAYNSFAVTVESAGGKRMAQKAQAVIDRTRFLIEDKKKFRGWTKGLLRDGDLFLQLIVENNEIVKVKKLAAEITHTRMNAEGEFPKDKKPYYQQSKRNPYDAEKEFDEWEIVHLKWDTEDGEQYGNSLLSSARLAWRRLESGEKDVSIRRKMRTGLKRHHKVGIKERPGTPQDVEAYKTENKATLDNPTDPTQDFYSNEQVEIITLEGDETVGDIEDLKWTEGLFSIVTGIPVAMLSGGRETATNMNVIQEQEEDYLRVIGDINEMMEEAFRWIFDIALLLAGINPDSVVYIFNWGAKDRDDTDRKIVRGERMLRMGFSFRTVMHTVDINGVTYEEEVERIKEQIEENVIPYKGVLVGGIRATGEGIIATSDKDAANEEDRIDLTNLFDGNGNGNGIHPSD